MATNPWEMDWSQPQAAPQAAVPGFIPGRAKAPDPLAVAREERAGRTEMRAIDSADRQTKAMERQNETQSFNNVQKLKDDYDGLPAVKEYRTAISQLATGLRTKDDATGDNALIYAYAKAMDPGSVVRESEMGMAASGASFVESSVAGLKKQFGIEGGGQLSPQIRERLRREMGNKVAQLNQIYKVQRSRFEEDAKAFGIDPVRVIGQHDGDAFMPVIQEYQKRRNPQAATPGMAADEEAVMGFDTPNAPGPRLSPEQDKELRAFVATKPTADALSGWFAGKGFGGLTPESAAAIADAAAKGQPIGGIDYAKSDAGQLTPEEQAARREAIVDPALRGVADTVSLGFADEISAAGKTVFSGGTMDDNLRRERAIDAFDEQNNPIPRIAGQIAGGFALPTGGATTARQLATLGGGYGAAYGFGSTDGSVGDRLLGAAGQGVLGAAVGGAAGRLLRQRPPGPPTAGQEVMQAAERQGIVPLAADVGGPTTRRVTSGFAQTPFGGAPIINRAQEVTDQVGNRVQQIAQSEGNPLRQEQLGERTRQAAQGYIDTSGEVARAGYGRARELSQDEILRAPRAFRNLNQQLRELSPTAEVEGPLIAGLERFRNVIADESGLRPLNIDSIRRLRTALAAEARTEGLRGTDYQRRANQVLTDLRDDIANGLNPEARAAFRAEDNRYRIRLETIDRTMNQILGPSDQRSAEGVANKLIAMSRGDSANFSRFLNSVSPQEAGMVRGSVIADLGRASNGQQNAAGDGFSLGTFLTNWDRLPERSRGALFRGENRAAIEDLVRVAGGSRQSQRFANTSNSGGAINVSERARAMSYGMGLATMGLSAVAESVAGRVLASPRFTRWLARAPNDPSRAQAWVNRLGSLATRDPSISADIIPIRDFLQQAIAQSPTRAAAQGQDENNGR